MEKNKAIPEGYMTVGEAAKKMGVTVRTLQYYDKKGLFLPSAETPGGRRLYTDKDIIKLHQILSMKHLGFSLDEIKTNLASLDTPADVGEALDKQATAVREKIASLSATLKEIELLKTEVLQMPQMDFKKYADIIVNLQMKNEFYWLIKHFDDDTLDYCRSRFNMDSAQKIMKTCTSLLNEAKQLEQEGILPESEKGLSFAKSFWDMVVEFTGGDLNILPKLIETIALDAPHSEWKENQKIANAFIESSIEAYFATLNYDPLKEEEK